jgi:uncharacterized protein involved in tolerance to divalent cations
MNSDIFSIDWITVDTVIIFFLLIILISVKLFQERYRWRNEISNANITTLLVKNIKMSTDQVKAKIKTLKAYYPSKLNEIRKQIIINFHQKSNNLINYITQGVVNSSYLVINAKLKSSIDLGVRFDQNKKANMCTSILNELKKKFEDETILSDVKIIPILYSVLPNSLFSFIDDPNISKIIIINPRKIQNFNENIQKDKINNYLGKKIQKIHFIFSERKYFFLKNNNIKKLRNFFQATSSITPNIQIIENSSYKFKNYETVLVGNILKIIYETQNKK